MDGRSMPFIDAIGELNSAVGAYGHGRYLGLEHLEEGEKVLEVREAPAAFILMQALRHLETATLTTGAIALKQTLERIWTLEAVEGRWSSDAKSAAEAGIESLAARVSGTVRFTLDYQQCIPNSICADRPLYITDRDAWEIEKARERGARSMSDYWKNSLNNNRSLSMERVA